MVESSDLASCFWVIHLYKLQKGEECLQGWIKQDRSGRNVQVSIILGKTGTRLMDLVRAKERVNHPLAFSH